MEKLKKRLDDLDLINNNIRLLNEMLSHFTKDSAEHEKNIIEVCNSDTVVPLLSIRITSSIKNSCWSQYSSYYTTV